MASVRTQRLAADFRIRLNDLLRTEVSSEYARNATVTDVRLTTDLSIATVYFSTLGNSTKVLEALNRVKGYLRSQLAKNNPARKTPQLMFKLDSGVAAGSKIDQLLAEIKKN